jgi:hypothetical protein
MRVLADSGSVALEGILVAAMIIPAVILAGICWIFWRAKKRDDEATFHEGGRSRG